MAKNQHKSVVDQLKIRVSLSDLAERLGLAPKRIGKEYKALCPFHNDKTPSMQLYEEAQRSQFHCFACGAHGDIFHLTQQVKEFDFRGAVDWLAKEYHIDVPQRLSSARNSSAQKAINSYSMSGFSKALEIYLRKSSRTSLEAWLATRQLPSSLIEEAQLTLAEPNTLTNEVESNASRDLLGILEDAGLIRRDFRTRADEKRLFLNLNYPYQDFFSTPRIVFPINDVAGNLQGFAGRLYGDTDIKDGQPKYLYTRKLPRAELLYRAEHAFKRIKANILQEEQLRTLYLCEGLLDALRLESLGFPAVSLLGAQASDKQVDCLLKLNGEISGTLRCAVFLDRDDAGRRGAARTIAKLIEQGIESVFIWPSPDKVGKDPEEILRSVSAEQAKLLLIKWTNPAALALLSESLQISPDDILDNEKWSLLSPGRRYWAISTLRKNKAHKAFLLSQLRNELLWQQDVNDYLNLKKEVSRTFELPEENEDDDQRLALAVDLAEAGARRGELSSDTAAWRRIKMASTAFYEAFKTRLRQNTGLPLEPFDAVYVSRGFGKTEPRLKAMPCPEDLIVQQYLLNDLLHDRISSFVPAVRYYRNESRIVTTCETNDGETDETFSFAYQIDMDVVEGRRPASDQGMFRHYFECWQAFNDSIKRQSRGMSQVHCLRLDLSRYYDNLRRVVVRDILRESLRNLFIKLEENELNWLRLFQPSADNRADRLADWFCDQSFGYRYYQPDNGEVKAGDDEFKGIPQGPVLSAWLATVALFPLDAALRRVLERYNTDGQKKVGYARYVDDVVLLADSQELLSVLRATAEDAANGLFVELRQKGDPTPPMRQDEFIRYLTEGRALPEYGPMEEFELFPIDIGDGETGWGMMNEMEAPPRYIALHLLRDMRLYTASSTLLLNQIHTALQADELRPGELGKATRWLWYNAVQLKNTTVEDVWRCYWESWDTVTSNVAWELNTTECPWDDPAFYALEGLEKLLETSFRFNEYQPLRDDEAQRKERIELLARFAMDDNFLDEFRKTESFDKKPKDWGEGIKKLPRQFLQRAIFLRWKAFSLVALEDKKVFDQPPQGALRASLARAWLTDAETCYKKPPPIAETGVHILKNPLREAMLLMHETFVLLGVQNDSGNEDLLAGIAESVRQVRNTYKEIFPSHEDRFIALLSYLPPSVDIEPIEEIKHAADLALETLANITPKKQLMRLLAKRPLLFGDNINDVIPLPPIPGVLTGQLLLIAPQSQTDASPKIIDSVKRIRKKEHGQESGENINLELWITQAEKGAKPVPLEWKEEKSFGDYILESAKWTSTVNLMNFSPPSFKIEADTLLWTADAYEALANLSYELGAEMEYVPAWPYIAANRWPGNISREPLELTLISVAVERSQLGRHAFMRDGLRGLRPVAIPEDFAHLWRIGVALTDSLGLPGDIDNFTSANISQNDQDDLANYLLRTTLSKLCGRFLAQGSYPVVLDQEKKELPNIIKRSLSLLRKYDAD